MAVEKKKEAARSPAIFMGTDFYQVIKLLMFQSVNANVQKDYDMWVSIIRQMYSMTHHFMGGKRDEVKKHISLSQNTLMRYRMSPNEVMARTLRETILLTEEKIYDAIGELLVKTSEADDDDMPDFKEVWEGR